MHWRAWAVTALISLLSACGGGGGTDSAGASTPAPSGGSGGGSSPGGNGGSGGGSSGGGQSHTTVIASGPTTTVASGSLVTFDVVIANSGSQPANHVAANVQYGSGLSLLNATCVASGGAACPTDARSLAVAALPAQGSLRFQLSTALALSTRGSVSSSIAVTADGETPGPDSRAQVAFDSYTADLEVTGAGPSGLVPAGGTATYEMTVTNRGPDPASNVSIENTVGAQQSLTSITCRTSGNAVCPSALGRTMAVPSLAVGSSITFTVTTLLAGSNLGAVSDTLYVGQAGDPQLSNNVATVTAQTAVVPNPGSPSFVLLNSDQGDYIGAGATYSYSRLDSVLTVSSVGNRLDVKVQGDEGWTGTFVLPASSSQLQAGTYANLTRFPFHDPAVGGLDWSGEGRGCNTSLSKLVIDSVTYVAGALATIDLRFEQHCEGAGSALRGQVHWEAGDNAQPPGPVNPPPISLWRAPAGSTPTSGNYVYLVSDPGDYIGAGQTATYTQANAALTLSIGSSGQLQVNVSGNDGWSGSFQPMASVTGLQPGYYGDLRRFPFHNPAKGGLDWSGNGRGCNRLTGWFAIDSLTYSNGAIASIDLRFEQHCEGQAAALRGQVHWVAGDPTAPPGPQSPPPSGLWNSTPGTTPGTGNYVYLSSETGDYIGAGHEYLYTPATGTVSLVGNGRLAQVSVNGLGGWTANFQAMNSIAQLQPGYYPGLQRYPFNNPTTGGLDWSGMGRGCNTLTGWFVVDSVSYVGGNLASLDLRFEQHCEGGVPALHGKIHWIN